MTSKKDGGRCQFCGEEVDAEVMYEHEAICFDRGGGRESGRGAREASRVAQAKAENTPSAANPAARHVHRIWEDGESPEVVDCEPCTKREERIRALEAELAEQKRQLAIALSCDHFHLEQAVDSRTRAERAEAHLDSHGYPALSLVCSECRDLVEIRKLAREREEAE